MARYWLTANKGPWALASVLGGFVVAIGVLIYSLFAEAIDRQNLTCLARNVYFEARGEPKAGQYAVAEVTMNRVASRHYPDTVCAVVYEQRWDSIRKRYVGAFSWTELEARATLEAADWRRAWEVAEEVYYRRQPARVEGALFYHAVYIRPSWSSEKTRVARIGKHVFYR